MEKINIKSSKGYLSAVVHNPKVKTDKLAILCPGFLDSKDYRHLVVLSEDLCAEGYAVVRFDPTGTWESEGVIADYTLTQYLEDVRMVLDYMLEKSEYKNIVIGGHSRGGRVAILYAARDSRVSTILGIMPSYGNFEGEVREQWEKDGIKISQRDLLDGSGTKEFILPFEHVLDMDKYDVLATVAKIKVPVILIAGELDDLVPPQDVKDVFDSANQPKKYVIIPGVGHGYRRNENEIEIVNEKILELLKSNMEK